MLLIRDKRIEVAGVSLQYDRAPVLENIDLTVYDKDFWQLPVLTGEERRHCCGLFLDCCRLCREQFHFIETDWKSRI